MPQIIAPPKSQPQNEPIITTCPNCQYTISYTEDEVDHVDNESMGVICPHCGGVVETEHIEPFTFPDTFYHFSVSEDAVCLSDDEVQQYVNVVKCKLQQECQVGEYTSAGSGDTMVFGFKMEDEDEIIVAKNYWSDSVFHED